MTTPWAAYCESAELAAELAQAAGRIGLEVVPRVETSPAAPPAHHWLWLCIDPPDPAELARLAVQTARADRKGVLCWISTSRAPLHALAADLSLAATWDVEAAVAVAALLSAGGARASLASRRGLPESLRARLSPVLGKADAKAGRLERLETACIGWLARGAPSAVPLGSPACARQALDALHACDVAPPPPPSRRAAHAGRELANEVLFGPPRRLSDPASKAALEPYGIVLPPEELCASPSRASSEAARMGFPVRITLASPDLRAWDEPDLTVDGVDNAARVRDVYRQLVSLAHERNPEARVLGVTVTQTRIARSLLSLRTRPLDEGVGLAELGFADPHGAASEDFTWLPLPTTPEAVERAIERLRGRSLVLSGTRAERASTCADLAALLDSLHAFMQDFAEEVAEVRCHPVALLVGGGLEAREAAVSVTDAYARAL